jgi:ferric-dicitrate binding protein FerR (iron transport regulator)
MQEHDDPQLTPEERKVREAVRALPEPQADPAFRRALAREFASGRFTPRRRRVVPVPRRTAWEWIALPALAAALLVLAFLNRGPGWEVLAAPTGAPITVGGQAVPADALAARLARGGSITVPAGESLTVRHPSGVVFEAAAGTAFTLPAPPGKWFRRGMSGRVDRGELMVLTGPPFAGRSLSVTTPEGTTDIVGTVFSVVRMPDLTCVCVLRGEARVGRDAAHMDAIPSGRRKVMFADGRPPMLDAIEPTHAGHLAVFFRDYGKEFR